MLFSATAICLSVLQWNKWMVSSFIGSILYLISIVWALVYAIAIIPIVTTLRCFTQLITLPINIPLYVISGTSIQSVISTTAKSVNMEILGIIFQYCSVLFLSGIALGITMGAFLGMVHINTYLRDHILEFNIKAAIKRLLQKVYNYIINIITVIVLYVKRKAQRTNKHEFKTGRDDSSDSPISKDDINIPLQWLKNFNFTEDSDIYDTTTIKQEEHTIPPISKHNTNAPYQTPPGSPKLNSQDNTEFLDESLDSSTIKTSTLKQRRKK